MKRYLLQDNVVIVGVDVGTFVSRPKAAVVVVINLLNKLLKLFCIMDFIAVNLFYLHR